ncbi:MAG: hypothetical protein K2O73_04465, partial [Lachnospiraceae bacterium]|nr:hypothetical protein [Lachnospiraceae bacterium]
YMSIEPVSRLPVTSKYATTYIHLDNLNNALGQYEEAHKNTDLTLTEEMIRNITAIIHGHRSMYDDTISTYQAGSIRDLPGFQYASLLDGLQKNYLDQVSGTVEECEAAYVGRKEAWEEEIRQRKEQAMISMVAAVGTLIIGGIVIVCTFGMATPLVVGTTAVTLSSVVSVSAGFAIGGATFLYGESNFCESYNSYQYGLKGDARTVAENPIRDTCFAGDPELYYTVGNVCTMVASMMIPVGGSMMAAVNAGTSPVRAGLTELGMLGYSSVMASETADIVTDMTDSELAGMVAGTIVGIESYGGLKTLDQSVNISGLYSVNMPDISKLDNVANSQKEMYGESNPSIVEKLTADSVKSAIERNGLTVDEFSELLQPNRVLSNSELELVQKVRNDIGLPDTGTTMSKTIPQSDLYKYLNGEYDSVRGFVSVDEYSNSLNGLNSVYEGNRLDYNNTAFKIGYGVDGISQSVGAPDTVYGKITYVLEDAESVNLCTDVPNVDNAPYTGTGFTGSKNIVLPEQVQTPRNFITGDLLGIYDSGTGAEISLY